VSTEPTFGPSGLNRRRAERIPMPPTGGVVSVVGGRILDVSPYGMLIETPVPMERDAVIPLRLVVAGEKMDVETRVAACTLRDPGGPGKRKVFGVGLEFTEIRSEFQERLRHVLASLTSPPSR
jgi:hypothetical protein